MKNTLKSIAAAITCVAFFLSIAPRAMADAPPPSVDDLGQKPAGELSLKDRLDVLAEKADPANRREGGLFKNDQWLDRLIDWDKLDKKEKVVIVNVAAIALVTIWGFASWDYGSAKMNFKNEGWFGHDTKYGGADKMGHLWSTYAFGDLLGYLYGSWGYDHEKAAQLSALSSWIFMGMMEVLDASSASHGFSYEDMTMNTIGALASYLFQTYPELDRKFDLRSEYKPKTWRGDIITDYEQLKYIAVLKLSGFDMVKDTFMKYFEIHVGYYTRGFDYKPKHEDRTRNVYAGIGVNIPLLMGEAGLKKTAKVFEYIQIPFTSYEVGARSLGK
ncbi:MAG: DUF2279 domain-containing protein [Bdellovibrionales bacterium]|nr:DUF2279 domain-containing protein [Bdellovibrionales bacterium]